MPDVSAADLTKLEEVIEGVKEALEEVEEGLENLEELTEELDDLSERIRAAKEDPEALSGESYGELAVDLIMIIPDNLPLPDGVKKVLRGLAKVIASFIEGATDFALSAVARQFRKLLGNYDPEEAARLASPVKQVQLWLIYQWKLGNLKYEKDSRTSLMTPSPVMLAAAAVVVLMVLTIPAVFIMRGSDGAAPGGAEVSALAAAGTAAPSATPAAPITVKPIVSVAGPTTEYVVTIEQMPAQDTPTFAWSGATCGAATANANRYSWDHREQVVSMTGGLGNRELGRGGDCNHRTDSTHGNPLIVAEITSQSFAARCTFQGAGSGTGTPCEVTRR